MREQKKQNVLTAIIIILVIALVMMVGSIVYEEMINMSKQPAQNVNAPVKNEEIKEDAGIAESNNTLDEDEEVTESEKDEELPKEIFDICKKL